MQAGRIVEASLGYFVTPLVNVVLGVAVLREPLARRQRVAVALAAAGVAILVLRTGAFPWVSLALAGSFGLYGLLRKRAAVDSVGGLFGETVLLAPTSQFLLGVLLYREPFGPAHAAAFACIWASLALYTWDVYARVRAG